MTKQELEKLHEATPQYQAYEIAKKAAEKSYEQYEKLEMIAVHACNLAYDTAEFRAWFAVKNEPDVPKQRRIDESELIKNFNEEVMK